jgi:hypothetical protein
MYQKNAFIWFKKSPMSKFRLLRYHCRNDVVSSDVSCSQSFDRELQQRHRLKNYNAASSLVRFENQYIFFYFEKRSSLLKRWRCRCKFTSM